MKKEIINAVQRMGKVPYTTLQPFQGNLKDLHKDDYEKLKKQIVDLDFSDPFLVWVDPKTQKHNMINGHQRLRTIQTMVEKEGYTCPELPVVFISAKSFKQAKQKVLAMTSQYGTANKQGLYEYIMESEIDPELLESDYKIPNIDVGKFLDEFVNEDNLSEPSDETIEEKADDKGIESPSKIVHTCPKCGTQFR